MHAVIPPTCLLRVSHFSPFAEESSEIREMRQRSRMMPFSECVQRE